VKWLDNLSGQLVFLKERPENILTWLQNNNHPTTIVSLLAAGPDGYQTSFAAFPVQLHHVTGSLVLSDNPEKVVDFISAFSDLFGLGEFPDEALFDLCKKMEGLCVGCSPSVKGSCLTLQRKGSCDADQIVKE
jgi:hypothetical protein